MPDSFYDVKGNEVSKDAIVAEFINNYTGSLTDFNEGSEIRNLLEAFAVYAMGLEERMNDILYIMDIMNADDEYLDLLASQPGIDLERNTGEEATGTVLFTIRNALLEELLIPAGTLVTSDTGVDFETVTDNTILPGELSRECMVEAIEVGIDGNIPANSILTKIDGYDAVEGFTVSNPEPFTGGVDYEEDDVFRERIIETMGLAKFGSKPYYISMLMSEFTEAHDISFDTTSSSTYSAVVAPNTYEGSEAQTKLVMDVAAYLADDNNIALGHTFNVISPPVQVVPVRLLDEMPESFSLGLNIVLSDLGEDTVNKAKEVLDTFLKGGSLSFMVYEFPGLNLNQEFDLYELRDIFATCLGDLYVGLYDVVDNRKLVNGNMKYGWNYV